MGPRLVVIALCALMSSGAAASLERSMSIADSLQRSAERLREYGLVENAAALEREAEKQRRETLSSSLLIESILKQLSQVFGTAVAKPVGFAGAITDEKPAPEHF